MEGVNGVLEKEEVFKPSVAFSLPRQRVGRPSRHSFTHGHYTTPAAQMGEGGGEADLNRGTFQTEEGGGGGGGGIKMEMEMERFCKGDVGSPATGQTIQMRQTFLKLKTQWHRSFTAKAEQAHTPPATLLVQTSETLTSAL